MSPRTKDAQRFWVVERRFGSVGSCYLYTHHRAAEDPIGYR